MKPAEVVALSITDAVAQYRAYMAGRTKRPASIRRFCGHVEECAGFAEWRTIDDVDFAGGATWLGEQVRRGRWSSTSHDAAASALRCFGRWMHKMNLRTANPLEHLEGIGDPGEPGSRPATLAEVRAIIAYAVEKARHDRRAAKCARPLFYTTLALTGFRFSEARALCWKDVDLAARTITTDPGWSKARRRDIIPIAPELHGLLAEYARTVPNTPGARVFPRAPGQHTLPRDREAAGVAYENAKGERFGYHSFRKFLRTAIDGTGAPIGVSRAIIRHHDSLDDRYCKHGLEAMHAAMARLPFLWPCSPPPVHNGTEIVPLIPTSLDFQDGTADIEGVKPSVPINHDHPARGDDPSCWASHSLDGERRGPGGRDDENGPVMGRALPQGDALLSPTTEVHHGKDATGSRGATPPEAVRRCGVLRCYGRTPEEAGPLQRVSPERPENTGTSPGLLKATGSRVAMCGVPHVAALPTEAPRSLTPISLPPTGCDRTAAPGVSVSDGSGGCVATGAFYADADAARDVFPDEAAGPNAGRQPAVAYEAPVGVGSGADTVRNNPPCDPHSRPVSNPARLTLDINAALLAYEQATQRQAEAREALHARLRLWLKVSALALALGAAAACANRAGMETQRVAGQGGAP